MVTSAWSWCAVPCHAVALTGVRAGVPLIVVYTLVSMWTIHLLNALYLEYKRTKVGDAVTAGAALSCCMRFL